jgi:hypothetical protein
VDLRALGTVEVRGVGRRMRLSTGELYGPGCPPDSVIGRMVWAAVRGEPIRIPAGTPPTGRPWHVWDLAEAVSAAVCGGRPSNIESPGVSVLAVAETIAQVVRPVPIHDERSLSPQTALVFASAQWKREFRYRLHHFAQWLAYECEAVDPATIT